MDYIRTLMIRQRELAEVFERRDAPDVPEDASALPAGKKHPAENGRTEAESTGGDFADTAPRETAVRTLYRELTQSTLGLDALRQAAEQEILFRRMQTPPLHAQTEEQAASGVVTQVRQSMRTSGIAGFCTRRSMEEISRFFERDSRRY